MTVRIEPDVGVVVTLPQRAPASDAARVLRELEGWVTPRLRELEERRERLVSEDPSGLTVLGRRLELRPEPGRTRAHETRGRLLVPAGDAARDAAIGRWCRARAREAAGPILDDAASTVGRTVERLRITDTRTRWGSCSSTGTVSLSWRLVLAPPDCLAYVAWHEACHLVHPNHGPGFWALVERHVPEWREPAAWLRENGADLRLRLPAA